MVTSAPPPVAGAAKGVGADDVAANSRSTALWTLVSRVTGLARIVVVAAVLGPTFFGNLFQAVNILPNLIFALISGATLNSLLVPPMVALIRSGERERLRSLCRALVGATMLGLGVLCLIGSLAAPLLIHLLTVGVRDGEVVADQRRIGSLLLILVLPQVVMYTVSGIATAVQNAHGRFALAAAAPAAENIGVLALLLAYGALWGAGAELGDVGTTQILVLGLGSSAAVLAHVVVQIIGTARIGVVLRPGLGFRHPDVREVGRLSVSAGGTAVVHALRRYLVLIVVGGVPGGVVAVQMATNFYNLPIGLATRPVASASVPELSRLFQQGQRRLLWREWTWSMSLALFLVVPATFGLIVLAEPISRAVAVGAMGSTDGVELLSIALPFMAAGLIGETVYWLCASGSFAMRDGRLPLRSSWIRALVTLGLVAAGANLVGGRGLLAVVGLALAGGDTAAAGYLCWAVAGRLAVGRTGLLRSLTTIVATSGIAVAAAYVVADRLRPVPGHTGDVIALVAGLGVAGVVHLLLNRWVGSPELRSWLGPRLAGPRSAVRPATPADPAALPPTPGPEHRTTSGPAGPHLVTGRPATLDRFPTAGMAQTSDRFPTPGHAPGTGRFPISGRFPTPGTGRFPGADRRPSCPPIVPAEPVPPFGPSPVSERHPSPEPDPRPARRSSPGSDPERPAPARGGRRDRSMSAEPASITRTGAFELVRLRARSKIDRRLVAALEDATLAGLLLAVGVVSVFAVSFEPVLAVGGAVAASLFVVVMARPVMAAYAYLGLAPLVVGFDRDAVMPLLRPSEALLGLVASALVWRRAIRLFSGQEIRFERSRLESMILLMAITSSVVPLLWLVARGIQPEFVDFLYAIAIWKFYGLFIVVRTVVDDVEQIERCIQVILATSVVVAVIAILQSAGIGPVVSLLQSLYPTTTRDLTNNRGSSLLNSSHAVGDVMAISLALVFGVARYRRWSPLLGGLAVLFFIGAFSSGQFSAIIGLAIGALIAARLTGALMASSTFALPLTTVATIALRPVVERRLDGVIGTLRPPPSWVARWENLTTFFWPDLSSSYNFVLGVRPAARLPAPELWREYVYMESGHTYLLWSGGIPFLVAYVLFTIVSLRTTRTVAARRDPVGAVAVAAYAGLWVVTVLMTLDVHLTLRGTADLLFPLLALVVVGRLIPPAHAAGWPAVAVSETRREIGVPV